jgi:hypothetical protein
VLYAKLNLVGVATAEPMEQHPPPPPPEPAPAPEEAA